MPDQLQLDIRNAAVLGPDQESVAVLLVALKGRGWVTAAELSKDAALVAALGGANDFKRALKRHAEAAQGWVLSGPRGYLHLRDATAEEVQQFTARQVSQARKMISRANKTRCLAHGLIS